MARWPLPTLRTLDRTRLSRAAIRYATGGWRVVPGAGFTGERYRCADAGCLTVGCHPIVADGSTDPAVVAGWWRGTAHSVLLATGIAFDVLDVPGTLGMRAARVPGPVAVAASGRWMFLVRPGDGLRPELAGQFGVVRHGHGSWIAAPPTREPLGRVRWKTSPDEVAWRLPHSYEVQERLVTALWAITADGLAAPRPPVAAAGHVTVAAPHGTPTRVVGSARVSATGLRHAV